MNALTAAIDKTGSVFLTTGPSKYRRPRAVVDTLLGRSLADAVDGRVVLVTGASEGIGRQVARNVAAAGGQVVLVARTQSKLDALVEEIEADGGTAYAYSCDMSDTAAVKAMGKQVLADLGRVDILVNNAGRSIRRAVGNSYDRMHDFERTMQLNYFGALQLILVLLPAMREQGFGHIVNISSIGVQAKMARFSAYIASKAALDAFSDCAQAEVRHDNVHFTTIFMPLVRTEMIAPTKVYAKVPALSPAAAGDLVGDALIHRPRRLGTLVPSLMGITDAVTPAISDRLRSVGFQLFDDSAASRGASGEEQAEEVSLAARVFATVSRVHW